VSLVRTEVVGGVLEIGSRDRSDDLVPHADARVVVSTPALEYLATSGVAQIRGSAGEHTLRLEASGASRMNVDVSASEALHLDASGTASIDTRGAAPTIDVDASGDARVSSTIP